MRGSSLTPNAFYDNISRFSTEGGSDEIYGRFSIKVRLDGNAW